MFKKSFLLCIVLFSIFCTTTTSFATSTFLTTKVPEKCKLTIEIIGDGSVFVNNEVYTKSTQVEFNQDSKIIISQKPAKNYELQKAVWEDMDITKMLLNGNYQASFFNNTTLKVVFSEKGTPILTGDNYQLSKWLIVLLLVCICTIVGRKKIS